MRWWSEVTTRLRAIVSRRSPERQRQAARDARGVRALADVVQDVRYAVRGWVRLPGFTAAVVLTLALGIGANTAVFSAVDSLILHPLPFKHGNRIVYGWVTSPNSGVITRAQPAVVDAWLARSHLFSGMTTYSSGSLALGADTGPTDVAVDYIDSRYLGFLDLRPVLGRAFTPADMVSGGADVALLAYGEWEVALRERDRRAGP